MVEVWRVRANQFNFKTKPLPLAISDRDLGPQVKKNAFRNKDLGL